MTPTEAAALLTVCAGFDNRKPDADQAKAWALALDGLRFVDCRDAVIRHYQRSRDWVMPFDVISGVKVIRQDRIHAYGGLPSPPPGQEDHEWWEWQDRVRREMGDGTYVPEVHEAPAATGRDVVRELETAGMRVNVIPPAETKAHRESLRAAVAEGRAQFQTTVKPEPEPLLRPEDHTREHPAPAKGAEVTDEHEEGQ